MESMKPLDIFNLIAELATAISVIVAFISIRSAVKANRTKMNVQVLMTYSERYERIMESFPENAFRSRFNMETLPPETEQLTIAILRYLNMCSEEFYFWQSKYIDDKVWKIWEHELRRMLSSKLVMREWQKLEPEFQSYPEFLSFVKKAQAEPFLASATDNKSFNQRQLKQSS
ncbi:MAG: hypothetical protein ABI954_15450 [Pyrinomonadaceae bacterium]